MTPAAGDPRSRGTSEADIRPLVARHRGKAPIWLVPAFAVLGAVLLFGVLENQRQARTAPATHVRVTDGVRMSAALPPLYFAPEPIVPSPPPPPPPPAPLAVPAAYQPSPPQVAPAPTFAPRAPAPTYSPDFLPQRPVADPQMPTSRGAVLVIDTTASSGGSGVAAAAGAEGSTGESAGGRPATGSTAPLRSTRLRRGATTVAQGTLIPAVLETALDSTRPGHVRAMVSRDVTGFDGSRVLIPRGTRLFGEYRADLAPGQNRAFVQWTQLVRPDGVSIAIESPAADRLGRTGIEGRVDSHFLERFGSALLQSTLNFGLGWAGRNVGGDTPVIVALPGSTQGGGASLAGAQVQPTLRVDAGVTVTVFVARDLEFPAEQVRR